jgi:hypothetical protein
MTDKPRVTMTPDELALELFTSSQVMTGGRAEAERLLQQIKDRHAHTLSGQQRTDAGLRAAEGETALAEYGRELADLIDPQAA